MFKKIYKILITIILFLSLIMSMNAGTTYLNSCKTSGWINGETYILNMTSITTNTCFLNNQGIDNINIIGNGQDILVNAGINLFYHDPAWGNSLISNWTFKDLSIIYTSKSPSNSFLLSRSSGLSRHNDINFNNITIKNGGVFVYLTSLGAYGWYNQINNWNFKNINYEGLDFLSSGGFYQDILGDFKINDSLIISDDFINIGSLIGFQTITNSVLIINNSVSLENTNPTISYTSSLLKGFSHTDNNDDNLADSNLYSGITNGKIYIDLFNNRYIQDFNEGNTFFSDNLNVISLNDEVLGTDSLGLNLVSNISYNFDYADILFSNRGVFVTTSLFNTFSCINYLTSPCYQSDSSYSGITSGKFRGIYSLAGSTNIEGITFQKSNPNNAHIISNVADITINDVTIKKNTFNKLDNKVSTKIDTTSEDLIKLKGNNIEIYNNTFYSNQGNNYELISIESLNPLTNKIYHNIFNGTSGGFTTEIFTTNSDTKFYNNYLTGDLVISNTIPVTLNSLVGYKHIDNKIYYFPVGNYYVNNVGCVDNDFNGFCDSSYTSGTVIDNYPLSSYPFDYTQHLFSASNIVNNLDFNVTLNSPVENQTINLSNGNDIIVLSFFQDSDFPDLTCDYVLDGNNLQGGTINNPSKNINYEVNVTGWNSKAYTYRVECYNNFSQVISNEITFYVSLGNVQVNGCTDNTANNYNPLANNDDGSCTFDNPVTGCTDNTATNYNPYATIDDGSCLTQTINQSSSTSYSSIDVIDYNSVDNTNANTIGFMQNIIGFVTNVGIPLGILLVVIISVFAVLRLLM